MKNLFILTSLIISGSLWADSKEDGPFETFWDNEKMREKGTLQNEKLEGFYEFFFRNGQLYQRANYKNGLFLEFFIASLKQGEFKVLYSNGGVASKISFKDGLRDGMTRMHALDGMLLWEGEYKEREIINK